MHGVVVVGTQWGDEGKGKVIDHLARFAGHVVRSQGGNNAGHTLVVRGQELKLHLLPSGILTRHVHCHLGAGLVIDPAVLCQELDQILANHVVLSGRLTLSPKAHVIFPHHRDLDAASEEDLGDAAVGTTRRGIGPVYADKAMRQGIRIAELVSGSFRTKVLDEAVVRSYDAFAERLRPYVGDVETILNEALSRGERVLFEGAQGTFLDLTFGTYPFVTSSSTLASGVLAGAGVGPTCIGHVVGVAKAYLTRVGHGPFFTEMRGDEAHLLDPSLAREFGTTTGRERRMGWLDLVMLREAVRLNGLSSLALTKLDVLSGQEAVRLCVSYQHKGRTLSSVPVESKVWEEMTPVYEELPGWKEPIHHVRTFEALPSAARDYVHRIEALTGIPISLISVGPDREETIMRSDQFPYGEV